MPSEAVLTRIEARLGELGEGVSEISKDRRLANEEELARKWAEFQARYEIACLLLYIEEHGLLELRQCKTLEGFCALFGQRWPGKPIGGGQQAKYVEVARRRAGGGGAGRDDEPERAVCT